MFRFLIGLFLILHGLVHLWLFTLSQRLVEFKPEMGWSGKSWLFTGLLGDSTTRLLASILFVVAAVAFVLSGVTIFLRSDWWWSMLLAASIVSAVTLCLFWDGSVDLIIQKGLIGIFYQPGDPACSASCQAACLGMVTYASLERAYERSKTRASVILLGCPSQQVVPGYPRLEAQLNAACST